MIRKFLTLLLLASIFVGCDNSSEINETELPRIRKISHQLIKQQLGDWKYNQTKDSVRVHDLIRVENVQYLLYSYQNETIGDSGWTPSGERDAGIVDYFIQLSVIEKAENDLGYSLVGGGGGGGTIEKNEPITIVGTGNKVYGLVQNPNITKVKVIYSDGKSVVDETRGQDYFFAYRESDKQLSPKQVLAMDNKGNAIFSYSFD